MVILVEKRRRPPVVMTDASSNIFTFKNNKKVIKKHVK